MGYNNYDNRKIIVAILYLKILLNKKYFKKFHSELIKILNRYDNEFKAVPFDEVLTIMGINRSNLQLLV